MDFIRTGYGQLLLLVVVVFLLYWLGPGRWPSKKKRDEDLFDKLPPDTDESSDRDD
jgi:hypothetical protein